MVPSYSKIGIWWFTKILNAVVGEDRYEALRIKRRYFTTKTYYFRQQILYRWFI
jgi:hypothetical protein